MNPSDPDIARFQSEHALEEQSHGSPAASDESETSPEAASGTVLEQILASHTFAQTAALRALLVYLWEHRDESISEYAVAVEALGRSASFDPKLDATVRVQVSRLRQRLEKYYEQEGAGCRERLSIPLGSHQIRVEAVERALTPAPLPEGPIIAVEWVGRRRRALAVLTLACVALTLTCAVLGIALYQARTAPARPLQEAGRFWKSFFANGRPTRIVLPSPVFFSFRSGVMLRDVKINDFLDGDSSRAVTLSSQIFGKPGLAENYTVTSDTFAAVQLARYLERCGLDTSLHSSADAPLDALDNENVIAIGTRGTLNAIKLYLDRMTIRSLPGDYEVEIRDPQPGEPARISNRQEGAQRIIWPGVIGLLPGRTGRTHLLALTAFHTSSLVAFLTSANGQDQLERIWKAHGSPEYFEIVIAAELKGEAVVRFWPVALHPVPAPR